MLLEVLGQQCSCNTVWKEELLPLQKSQLWGSTFLPRVNISSGITRILQLICQSFWIFANLTTFSWTYLVLPVLVNSHHSLGTCKLPINLPSWRSLSIWEPSLNKSSHIYCSCLLIIFSILPAKLWPVLDELAWLGRAVAFFRIVF